MSGFNVEIMPGRRIVHAAMTGLFSSEDAAGMTRAYSGLLGRVGYAPDTFDLIVDVSTSPIQPADIVQALSDFVTLSEYKPARIAFVHGDNVAKIQARRVSADLAGRSFATTTEAMAWLT